MTQILTCRLVFELECNGREGSGGWSGKNSCLINPEIIQKYGECLSIKILDRQASRPINLNLHKLIDVFCQGVYLPILKHRKFPWSRLGKKDWICCTKLVHTSFLWRT